MGILRAKEYYESHSHYGKSVEGRAAIGHFFEGRRSQSFKQKSIYDLMTV